MGRIFHEKSPLIRFLIQSSNSSQLHEKIFIRVITYNCHFHIFHTNISKLLDRNHYVYLQWLLSVRLRKQAILLFVYHPL
jgi:hypothetical protein